MGIYALPKDIPQKRAYSVQRIAYSEKQKTQNYNGCSWFIDRITLFSPHRGEGRGEG